MPRSLSAVKILCLALSMLFSGTAFGFCQQPSLHSGVPSAKPVILLPPMHLSDMATADPQHDFGKALLLGDLRFVGLNGYSLMVPGVVASTASRIVELKGVRSIQGTSDDGNDPEQQRLQRIADRYAVRYNTLLLAHLRQSRDPDVRRVRQETETELRRMERGSPVGDAAEAVRAGHCETIMTPVGEYDYTTPGLTYEQAMDMQGRDLVFSPDLATEEQTRRMRNLLVSYVAPYNRTIYRMAAPARNR